MYPIPGADPSYEQLKGPANVVHGQLVYVFGILGLAQEGIVPDGVFNLWVTLVGAGGEGVSGTASGAGGGVFYKQVLRVVPGAAWLATVGQGGQSGGAAGSASTFVCCGNTLTANGGQGFSSGANPVGGSATGADLAGATLTGFAGGGGTPDAGSLGFPGGYGLGPIGAGGSSVVATAGNNGICIVEW
jgi:hypothetical protein